MLLSLLLCFAIPAIWTLYALLFRRYLAIYIPMFLAFTLLSAIAASAVQALTQPIFSEFVVFSGGTAALVLHSFVQAGLIEEAFKTLFFFFALRRVFSDSRELYGISESVAFNFAIFSGSLFASFETLAGIFYLPGAAVTRLFTAHILHPAALLVTASGVFFGKMRVSGFVLPCCAAVLVHGFYNFAAGARGLSGAVLYTAGAVVLTAALWLIIFGRVYPPSGKRAPSQGGLGVKKAPEAEESENQ